VQFVGSNYVGLSQRAVQKT